MLYMVASYKGKYGEYTCICLVKVYVYKVHLFTAVKIACSMSRPASNSPAILILSALVAELIIMINENWLMIREKLKKLPSGSAFWTTFINSCDR